LIAEVILIFVAFTPVKKKCASPGLQSVGETTRNPVAYNSETGTQVISRIAFRAIRRNGQRDGLPPSFHVVQVLWTDDAQAGHRRDGEGIGEQFDKSDFFCRVIPER
jgi:hypothetical protein